MPRQVNFGSLSRFQNQSSTIQPGSLGDDRLSDLPAFGSNPGALRGRFYLPPSLNVHAPLVVVLHGGTQNAAAYDHGSGWSRLADEEGFALLYPEQQRGNNAALCFNWFNLSDTQRDAGEALSVRQMVAAMVAEHGIDPDRVFITGLSAGGAMASVMLAAYPDVFAGGAIIAGLPYGTATSIAEAFDRMRAHGGPVAEALGPLVAAATSHKGSWPTISVWHGDSDTTVFPENAALIVEQWRAIHGVEREPSAMEHIDGQRRRVWCNADGLEVIEEYRISGLGHGTPLKTSGDEAYGSSGPYMLEAGISSTRRIADFWGLTSGHTGCPPKLARPTSTAPQPIPNTVLSAARGARGPQPHSSSAGIGSVIEGALRAAGLMR